MWNLFSNAIVFILSVLVFMVFLTLGLESCSDSKREYRKELQFKISTQIYGVDGEITKTTQIHTYDGGWVDDEIYTNTVIVSPDEFYYVNKTEKEKAMAFFAIWLEANNVTDTIRVND